LFFAYVTWIKNEKYNEQNSQKYLKKKKCKQTRASGNVKA